MRSKRILKYIVIVICLIYFVNIIYRHQQGNIRFNQDISERLNTIADSMGQKENYSASDLLEEIYFDIGMNTKLNRYRLNKENSIRFATYYAEVYFSPKYSYLHEDLMVANEVIESLQQAMILDKENLELKELYKQVESNKNNIIRSLYSAP